MRILLLCHDLLCGDGGAQRHTLRLAREFDLRGHGVAIMTNEPRDTNAAILPATCAYPTVVLPTAPWRESFYDALRKLEGIRGGYRLFKRLSATGRLAVLSSRPRCPSLAKPDLFKGFDVVIHTMSGATAMAIDFDRAMSRMSGIVTVAMPLYHPRMGSADPSFQRVLHDRYTHIVTNTDFEMQYLTERGWPREKITTIGAGSDEWTGPCEPLEFRRRHGIPQDAPLVLFLGRKNYGKGAAHMVQAMDAVCDAVPQCRLVVMGFSDNTPAWIDGYIRLCKPHVARNIVNLDDVSEPEKESALAACQVMAMPSINDSFGIVYLDAWRYGAPVIGCRNTCCDSLIADGRDGLLVEFGNVPQIARAIVRLLKNTAEAAAFGAAGRTKWRESFTWPKIADRMEDLLTRLCRQEKKQEAGPRGIEPNS